MITTMLLTLQLYLMYMVGTEKILLTDKYNQNIQQLQFNCGKYIAAFIEVSHNIYSGYIRLGSDLNGTTQEDKRQRVPDLLRAQVDPKPSPAKLV